MAVKKAPKSTKPQAKPKPKAASKPAAARAVTPPKPSADLVRLADYINPRALDAAQMVMVVSAALQPKDGAPPALTDEVRAGLVRILEEVTGIIMGIKSQVASAVHPGSPA